MIDHVGLEVSDLERSARFYDAIFFPLGVRRLSSSPEAIAYGVNEARLWLLARERPGSGAGHVAFAAAGKVAVEAAHAAGLANGGSEELIIVEVQRGDYTGEDDITRIEDDYGRRESAT